MEIIISVILGLWIMLAGVLCFMNYKNDYKSILNNEEDKGGDCK